MTLYTILSNLDRKSRHFAASGREHLRRERIMVTETASSEATGSQENGTQAAPAEWWCNFCGFATNDQKEYLQHSCAEVLQQKGQKITPTGQNECR
jgi:hypothetical protein